MTTHSAICLARGDNVGVVTSDVRPGIELRIGDQLLAVKASIPFGHKIALADIGEGEKVIKFGVPVGRARAAIKAGEHVHIHNIESDYINNAVDHYEVAASDREGNL